MKGRIFCKNVFKITINKNKNRKKGVGGLKHITEFKELTKYPVKWKRFDMSYPPLL